MSFEAELNALFFLPFYLTNLFRFYNSFGFDTTTYHGFYVTILLQTILTLAYVSILISLTVLQLNLCLYVNGCFQDFMALCDDINDSAIDTTIHSCSRNEIRAKYVRTKQLIKSAIGLHIDLFK